MFKKKVSVGLKTNSTEANGVLPLIERRHRATLTPATVTPALPLDLDSLAEQALLAATRLTATDFAAIAVQSAPDVQLAYRWFSPLNGEPLSAAMYALLCQPFPCHHDIAGQVLARQTWVHIADYRHYAPPFAAMSTLNLHAMLAYPVYCNRHPPAVVMVATCGRPTQFSEEQHQFLATIARQLAIALDHAHLLDVTPATTSATQWERLVLHNADAILVTDDAGCVQFANPAAQTLLGRSLPELMDFPLGVTSQRGRGELDLRRPDGQHIRVELRATATTWNGQSAHLLTLRDLTERCVLDCQQRHSAQRLHNALVQTLEAVSRTVETRDPYTASHQRRVAALAHTIALEIGLPAADSDGIYMGGLIHDIGKLYIPEQILSRAGHLTEIEFLLIKTHCAVGRDIIAGIVFPWPLAAMIHQHHERLNGSGYPQGLRGEHISLEARVLAVADVVDAVSAHRPYRKALGLEAALIEIQRGNGYYDPEVVAACVRLFNVHGLRLADLENMANPLLVS